jgi:hypothetical protein
MGYYDDVDAQAYAEAYGGYVDPGDDANTGAAAQAAASDPYQATIQTIDRMQSVIDASKARDAQRSVLAAESAAAQAALINAARLSGAGAMPSSAMAQSQRPGGYEAYSERNLAAAADAQRQIDAIQAANQEQSFFQNFAPGAFLGNAQDALMKMRLQKVVDDLTAGASRQGYFGGAGQPAMTGMTPIYDPVTGNITGYRESGGRLVGRDYEAEREAAYQQSIAPSDDIVPPVINPATGQQQCPDGYIFDEDLNACRVDTGMSDPNIGSPIGSPAPGAYGRVGLLDTAPTGLLEFNQRYGAGFGSPSDFGAANLAFRKQGATYPQYFDRPPQLTGYTLL